MIIEVQINRQNVSGVYPSKDLSWAVRAHYCELVIKRCVPWDRADEMWIAFVDVVAIPHSPMAWAAKGLLSSDHFPSRGKKKNNFLNNLFLNII